MVNNFIFRNPTKLIFGKGQVAILSTEIPLSAKVMITYGGGSIKRNGIYDAVKEALKNHTVVEFGGIEPNPKYETLMEAVELGRANDVDFLLAVGGGSTIDGTKFIAVALNFNESDEPWGLMCGKYNPNNYKATPIGTVLTLPATGSEMNKGAVISRRATEEKFVIYHDDNYPRFSILDPEACYSLPQKQVANGLADTFCHVLEQYLTVNNGRVNDRFCEALLLNVVELAPQIVEHHDNYELMTDFMLSATMGLNGFVGMGATQDWATHMIGHELTALSGLDHGVTLSIIGPALMDVMKNQKWAKLLQYGERVFGITDGDESQRVDAAIASTRALYESLGIKTYLSDYGIGEEIIDKITDRFEARNAALGENGAINHQIVKQILTKTLNR